MFNDPQMQKKLLARKLAAMTPEERAEYEAANAPKEMSKDNVKAMLAQMGGDQPQQVVIDTTKVIVNKNAPPPPPPPPMLKGPPPPASKPAPPKPAAQKPAQQQQQQQQPPQVQQQSNPVQPPLEQKPVEQNVEQKPEPPKEQPRVQPEKAVQPQPKQIQDDFTEFPDHHAQKNTSSQDVSFPTPQLKQGQSNHDQQQEVEFLQPQNKQKGPSVAINYPLAVSKVNLLEALQKVVFEKMDDVPKLCPPDKNQNPRPNFKSIEEGLRYLDKSPEEAVKKLQFLSLKGYAFCKEIYFPNDNNEWCKKQMNQSLELIKIKHKEQISEYIKNQGATNPIVATSTEDFILDINRYNAAIEKVQSLMETKVKTQKFGEIAPLSALAEELRQKKLSYEAASPQAKASTLVQVNAVMASIETHQ